LDVQATFILGDITENKDKHSSILVNKIVDSLKRLRPPVFILRGNHDGNNPDCPFFRFLSSIDGLRFIVKPCFNKEYAIAFIPHCRTQAEFDEACKIIPAKCAGVMLHNTFERAIAESGVQLSGLSASLATFKGAAGVWAGDVHKPQRSGPITYVGSPYHVKFGDRFIPRVLVVSDTGSQDLHFPAPRKWARVVQDPDDVEALFNDKILREGDQIKLTCALTREEVVEWPEFRRKLLERCRYFKLEVFGVTLKVLQSAKRNDVKTSERTLLEKAEVFDAYCKQEKIPSAQREAGRIILTEK
jgi:DNA repair exonuclease SbcCD nuclease subunit